MNIQFNPPVIAHRGARVAAPENTISSFIKAKHCGCRWVEFDVRMSACGELIIFHDDTLDRTTNGRGFVESYPYDYLKTLDAGGWFSKEFSGVNIPTFRETLIWLQSENMAANIEIKTRFEQAEIIAHRVLSELNAITIKAPFFVSSFEREVLRIIRKKSPDILLAYLMHEWQSDWQVIAEELNAFAIDVHHEILNQQKINEIKNTKRFLLAYTVNDPKRAQTLWNMGVDAVFSDDPLLLISFLRL